MPADFLSPRLFLLIAAGGVLGTFARYGIQLMLQAHPHAFPWGTLVVNLIGCFVFGFFVRYLAGDGAVELRVALTVGFCGAFTTMSSFSYESLVLLESRRYAPAAIYLAISIAGSLTAVGSGVLIAQALKASG